MPPSGFAKVIDEAIKERKDKEKKLGITRGQINALKDYSNLILEKVNYIEFTQLAVEDKVIDYENGRKIIDHQKEQISEDIEELKFYLKNRRNEKC